MIDIRRSVILDQKYYMLISLIVKGSTFLSVMNLSHSNNSKCSGWVDFATNGIFATSVLIIAIPVTTLKLLVIKPTDRH
jgi:hypothetical protein